MRYLYLATPYTLYPDGIHQAYIMACQAAAEFCRWRLPVYSPIAHTHGVAMHGGLDPLSHGLWLPLDEAMMDGAAGLVVLCAEGWDRSAGVKHEIQHFTAAKKPIFYIAATSPIPDAVIRQLRTVCGVTPP